MKRDEEIKQGKYEWELKYRTSEKPLSKQDKFWKLLFSLVLLAGTLTGIPKLTGISYQELFGRFINFVSG